MNNELNKELKEIEYNENIDSLFKKHSIKELSDKFNIPYRTIQNWKSKINRMPDYLYYMITHTYTLESNIGFQQEEINLLRNEIEKITHDLDYLKTQTHKIWNDSYNITHKYIETDEYLPFD